MDTMRTAKLLLLGALALPGAVYAQGPKKPLDHDVYDSWKFIRGQALSDDGRWALYSLVPQDGDAELRVAGLGSGASHAVPRGVSARFSEDSRFVVFTIKPAEAAVEEAKRKKKKPEEQPKDSLGILKLETGELVKADRVKSFALPEEGAGFAAYLLEKEPAHAQTDSAKAEGAKQPEAQAIPSPSPSPSPSPEKRKDVGTPLVLRNLGTGAERRFEDVVAYVFSKDGKRLAYAASTKEGAGDGVFVVETASGAATAVLSGKGHYRQLAWDERGEQLGFVTDRDDYEAKQPAYALYHWRAGAREARRVAAGGTAGIRAGWQPSEHGRVSFSESGRRLLFGTAPAPAPEPDEDSLPPADERVKVDIWNWKDPFLQPMQLVRAEQEKKRSYLAVVHLREGKVVQLGDERVPEVQVGRKGDAELAIGSSDLPYRQLVSWDGSYNDIYVVDVSTGRRDMVLERLSGGVRLSPGAKYAAWYDDRDRAWFATELASRRTVSLTARLPHPVHDELDDHPAPPPPHGAAGWTADEEAFLVYDRHDVWATDPTGRREPRSITEGVGREQKLRFRYVRLDREEEGIDPRGPLVLSAFDLATRADGFYRDRVAGSGRPERLLMEDRAFSNPEKAEDAGVLLYTRSSFQEFPDLWTSDLAFGGRQKISAANPQQAQYLWGSAELVEWKSMDRVPLQGVLYKPENFDPAKKYPMLVYFYERLSDNLHQHHAPAPGGSSINVSFYVSRGYLVFLPDVPYRIGYPGESALHAIVPGVLELVRKGFVDETAIGVQGHSWGGYQIAYMVTKTHLFAAAEAGAPVSNMISAYGGIRWGTGMSRMFQYEKTQSRIGGSLWDSPMRFIENSPIFWADKVETPLLMMHNDEDGAVPWYQGIEYFVALRRLDKPVWMINYNGEDHGLRRYHNRKDWAIRMQQFFDHYLKGAPAPVWLAEGVPAVAKGRTLGLEPVGSTPAITAGDDRGGKH